MRSRVIIGFVVNFVMLVVVCGHSLGQTPSVPNSPVTQPPQKRQGFFDYALGKINPRDNDYGASMASTRSAMVENSIDDLYFWSNVVTLILLCGLAAIVLLQWRSADKREVIAASLIAQLWNARVSDRIELQRCTEQFNRLVETHNAEVERSLMQKSHGSESEKDADVSRDVADQHGAHQGAGRYNKQLLRGADKLDELRTLAGQIRQHFYKITLPWSDEGFRLLPANFYFDLMARMREFEAGFEQGVESFLGVYPQYIEQVRPELNGLFREEDYPAAEKLRKKFGVKLEVLPIPSGADFRVQMSAEEQARVSREIDANVRESLMRGTEDLWKRLREVVAHMVDRLNEPESRFHGSLVTNVLDLVEILPRLNVNGDADLNRFAEQVKERLCNYSAQDLKKHDLLRVTTAADAANIVAEMDGLLRSREAAEPAETPSADDIFNRMSAYMEAPAAA